MFRESPEIATKVIKSALPKHPIHRVTKVDLEFIPEKQTDFIFTLIAEEFGFLGASALILLFLLIILYCFYIGLISNNYFGKILATGLGINFALYVFINIGMVTGLLPVVGVPLPLVSYGGTAMLTLFFGFGLVQSVYINKEMVIGRNGSIDDE
jgi:rod shape determining protein RodA